MDFYGDMFPHDELEIHIVKEAHLQCLRRLLIGDVGQQSRLFLWAYKFDVIPVELIRNIHEEFFHSENTAQTSRIQVKDNSTHYTPTSLADFVLSHTLTVERLRHEPRVMDSACGSGIFLVECFKRIVRYHIASHPEVHVDQEFLKGIIARQIAGMDVNGDALRIAALSLNLAYLGFLDPSDILEQQKLPVLIVNRNQTKADVEYLKRLLPRGWRQGGPGDLGMLLRIFAIFVSECTRAHSVGSCAGYHGNNGRTAQRSMAGSDRSQVCSGGRGETRSAIRTWRLDQNGQITLPAHRYAQDWHHVVADYPDDHGGGVGGARGLHSPGGKKFHVFRASQPGVAVE